MKYDIGQASLDMMWYVCWGIILLKSDGLVFAVKKTHTRKVR